MYIACGDRIVVVTVENSNGGFRKKERKRITKWFNSSNPGYIPKGSEFAISKKSLHHKFIAVVFPIPKIWKWPKCPSREEQVKKIWCIFTGILLSHWKNKEILSFATTWMDPEGIILIWVRERKMLPEILYMWIEK